MRFPSNARFLEALNRFQASLRDAHLCSPFFQPLKRLAKFRSSLRDIKKAKFLRRKVTMPPLSSVDLNLKSGDRVPFPTCKLANGTSLFQALICPANWLTEHLYSWH
jgi:hypothetical protein